MRRASSGRNATPLRLQVRSTALWTTSAKGFQALGVGKGVKVGLTIRFEFANAVLGMLLSRTFEKNCGEMIDAFVARYNARLGTRVRGILQAVEKTGVPREEWLPLGWWPDLAEWAC